MVSILLNNELLFNLCVCVLGFKGLLKELFQIKGKQVGKPRCS